LKNKDSTKNEEQYIEKKEEGKIHGMENPIDDEHERKIQHRTT
jgi:hypothetical protein